MILADDGDLFLATGGPVVHGCVAGRWVQYWLAWSGDRDHAGTDWEMVMVRPGVEAVFARHRTAERRPLARVELEGDRLVVYAGRDKHSSRYRAGWHRNGWHLERANGRVRLDCLAGSTPLQFGVPLSVRNRLAHRDPDAWLAGLGV